jgi:TRAP-type C4-dicarboxylate transport system substrate-binding protein
MMIRTLAQAIGLAVLLAGGLGAQTVLNVGTLASDGTPWHQMLQQIGQEWRKLSEGKISLRIYGAGVQGDEPEMLQRVQLGQLHGVMISNAGLPLVDRSTQCLTIPMMLDNYPELDHVLERLGPKLEERLLAKGYVVLVWGDVGWIHFFTKKQATSLAELKKMTLFTGAGDPEVERLYTSFGFRVRPLAFTDMLMALQTGMVEAFDVPPLFALVNQSFALAKNMVDVRWAPLPGATLVSARAWDKIPLELRPKLIAAARQAGRRFTPEIRKMGEDAVGAMEQRGLQIVRLDAAARAQWRSEVEAGWPKLRGNFCESGMFDDVKRARDEYRANAKPGVVAK